jgi:hypothetical protein
MHLLLAIILSLPPIRGPIHVAAAQGCVASAPCSVFVNVPFDSAGILCSASVSGDVWGLCDSRSVSIVFEGVPVIVQRIDGDFIGWLRGAAPAGTHAGMLVSFCRSDAGNDPDVSYSASGCFVYVQGSAGSGDFRGTYSEAGGPLAADNALVVKLAEFLNDSGRSLHLEATARIWFYRGN